MLSEEWNLLKSRVSEICVKQIHVNQGVVLHFDSDQPLEMSNATSKMTKVLHEYRIKLLDI